MLVITQTVLPSKDDTHWFPRLPFLPQNPEEAQRFFQVGSDFSKTMLVILLTVMIVFLLKIIVVGSIRDKWKNRKELKELRQHNKQVKANLKKNK